MKLCELLLKSRSVRSFVPGAPVPPEVLRQMIDATRLCPSSANLQALKFRPVTHETECRKVFDAIKWAGYLPAGTLPPKGHESTAYVVICLDKSIASNVSAFNKDTGICAQTMMLCAAVLGYGGCMIGSFDGEKLKSALNLGDNLEKVLGSFRYLIFYLACAVGANVISCVWYFHTGMTNVLSAGASEREHQVGEAALDVSVHVGVGQFVDAVEEG